MPRLKIALLVAIFAFSGLIPLHAAVKAGSACPKHKAEATFAGYKYICIKNGKRLIWSKGTKLAVDKPLNTIAPQVVPESTYLATKRKSYEAIRLAVESAHSNNLSLVYHISESFPESLKNLYVQQVEYASKLYSSFFTKKEIINIYLYTEKDAATIQSDSNLNFNYSSFDPWFKDWISGRNQEHNIGLASYFLLRNSPPQGHAGLAVFSGSNLISIRPYGIQVMQHEYWHVVQDYYMQSGRGTKFDSQDSYDLLFPPTFREGSTNTISFALACNSLTDYLKLYEIFIQSKKTDFNMQIFQNLESELDVVQALKSIEFRSKNTEAHEASYLLGQLLYEWVIAEYGFEGYRKIITNQLIGNSFDDNLKTSLGITSDELYRKAAGHILAAFSQ